MTSKQIMEIVKKHLAEAESDLEKCGRGSNWGRVNALRDLAEELGLPVEKSRKNRR